MRFNPVLEKLTPYRAGPPLHEVQERYQLERVAMLSANEVPWGPFPEVVDADDSGACRASTAIPTEAASSCGLSSPSSAASPRST